MDSSNLKQINELQADKALEATKHAETIGHLDNVAQTVLSATSSLIQYLEGHTTKTEVVNQLQSISTPDVEYVVKAVNILDDTLKARPLTDLSEITQLMQGILAEAQAIPKSLPEQVTPEVIDYSERFAALEKAVTAVTDAVKAQDLHVDAPVVNVPETSVNVAAPDLKPTVTGLKAVEKAVRAIVIPETKIDLTPLEKQLIAANKTLDKLLKKPVSAGGGGGGSSWPAIGSNSLPAPLKVDTAGNLQVAAAPAFAQRIDDTAGTTTYIGKALPGTAIGSAAWQIQKVDTTSGTIITFADGDANYDNVWSNRASLTYS